MRLSFSLGSIVGPKWVDTSLSDCIESGFSKPGYAVLRTDPVDVSTLPNAEAKQYGHDTAVGTMLTSVRTARKMFRDRQTVTLDVTVLWRNKERRKEGSFRCTLRQPNRNVHGCL